MKQFLGRLAIYLLLIGGSLVFMVPLLWMISTALKPIDQSMSMPPTWVPYRLFLEQDGKKIEVKKLDTIDVDSAVVTIKETGERRVIPKDLLKGDQMVSRDNLGQETQTPVVIERDVPASTKQVWYRVIPVEIEKTTEGVATSETAGQWDVVSSADLIKKAAPRWDNFYKAIKAMKFFPMYLKNTVILCILTVIGTVSSSALAAYGFARIPWKGRNKVFLIALATMMIPFPVVMVPIYSMFRALGWIGTMKPLWVGSFCAGAFNVFLLRQFFMSIPKDLSDAARIDGCSEFRIFLQIILPLCKPALMVVGLFQFMATWNDFLGPLIYLTNQKDFTLALGLQFFQSQHGGSEWHYLMAASTLVVLPVIVLFFFTQKTFIEGISMTGLKG